MDVRVIFRGMRIVWLGYCEGCRLGGKGRLWGKIFIFIFWMLGLGKGEESFSFESLGFVAIFFGF